MLRADVALSTELLVPVMDIGWPAAFASFQTAVTWTHWQ